MEQMICIDIGGTAIKYGIIVNGDVQFQKEMATEAFKGGPEIMKKVKGIVRALKSAETAGVAISTAGMVDPGAGRIFYAAPLIPDYTGTEFKKEIEEEFSLPCEVENDVNCAGLAEYESGAGRGAKMALMLTIGTGIGGCCIMDGKVLHGASNSACEVGYMHMRGSDFQSLGAASVLTKKVAERKGEPEEKWDGRAIFQAAKAGDAICLQEIDALCDVLGQGIANIAYILNPDVVILGGGIMAQKTFLEGRIRKALEKYLLPSLLKTVSVRFAEHKNAAGMYGAYINFQNRQGGKL